MNVVIDVLDENDPPTNIITSGPSSVGADIAVGSLVWDGGDYR